jgi:DNA-binding NarL/FixJ family response regulator
MAGDLRDGRHSSLTALRAEAFTFVTTRYKNLPRLLGWGGILLWGAMRGTINLNRLDHLGRTGSGLAPVAERYVSASRRNLAIVDQSPLRRECLKLALSCQPRRWRVTDVAEAAELVQRIRRGEGFDVIVMGASTCAHIDLSDLALLCSAVPEIPILVTADCEDPGRARVILRHGARGFLPTSLGLKVLIGALERVRSGGTYIPLAITAPKPLAMVADGARQTPWRELTRRQRDVLALISEGKSNKLIADALTMTESTVKAHVKQIIKRLNVTNRTQAALIATRANWQGARH